MPRWTGRQLLGLAYPRDLTILDASAAGAGAAIPSSQLALSTVCAPDFTSAVRLVMARRAAAKDRAARVAGTVHDDGLSPAEHATRPILKTWAAAAAAARGQGSSSKKTLALETTLPMWHGQFLARTVTKGVVNAAGFQVVRRFGSHLYTRVLTAVQRMLECYLEEVGAAIGLADCVNPCEPWTKAILGKLDQYVRKQDNCDIRRHNVPEDKVMRFTDTVADFVQSTLQRSLSRPRPRRNNLADAIASGGKGSKTHQMQMVGALFQQRLSGQRIRDELSHCRARPFDAVSSGFGMTSFRQGLHPVSEFHHCQTGKQGMIDTGIGTSAVGHSGRCTEKSMQGICLNEDGETTRDLNGRIIGFKFGGEQVNTQYLESVPSTLLATDDRTAARLFGPGAFLRFCHINLNTFAV